MGVFVPSDLTNVVVQRLSVALQKAVESDAYQEYADKTFSVIAFQAYDEFATDVADLDKAAPQIIDDMGLTG